MKTRLFATAATTALLCGTVAPGAFAGELPTGRLAGANSSETSMAVASHVYGNGANTVYVASNVNPVDALPAATLGDGAVLLTNPTSLTVEPTKFSKNIVILGGPGAVSDNVAQILQSNGATVSRLAGPDRNVTAFEIAKAWKQKNGAPSRVYVTKNTGGGSPDAVSASVLRDGPILTFTNDSSMNAIHGMIKELSPNATLVALGGTGVVPDSLLASYPGSSSRLAGADRYETAYRIAEHAKNTRGGAVAYVASGSALKDAMVAGAVKDGYILLTDPSGERAREYAKSLSATKIVAVGGTSVISDATLSVVSGKEKPQPPATENPTGANFDSQGRPTLNTDPNFVCPFGKQTYKPAELLADAYWEIYQQVRAERGLSQVTRTASYDCMAHMDAYWNRKESIDKMTLPPTAFTEWKNFGGVWADSGIGIWFGGKITDQQLPGNYFFEVKKNVFRNKMKEVTEFKTSNDFVVISPKITHGGIFVECAGNNSECMFSIAAGYSN